MTYEEFLASAPHTQEDVIKACQDFRRSEEKDVELGEYLKELIYKSNEFKGNRLLQQNYKTLVSPTLVKIKVESGEYDAEGDSAKVILEFALEDIQNAETASEKEFIRKKAWKTIQYLPKKIKDKYNLLTIYSRIKHECEQPIAA